MAVSEAQKKATAKWQAENMTSISLKVRKDFADEFKRIAEANGTTRNQVLLQAAKEYVAKYADAKADV